MPTEQEKRTLPNFSKFFPNEFVHVLTSLGSKRADILAFILKSRRRSDNFFVGSYDVIAKNTNTSIHTVSDTINTFFDLLAIYRQQLIDVFGEANLPKYVFYNLRGDHRLKPAEFTDYCKELSHKINMHITPHKFRHTLATLMVKSGESIVTVADAIGDGIEIAYKFYCNDKEKQKQEASRRFNKNFEESGS